MNIFKLKPPNVLVTRIDKTKKVQVLNYGHGFQQLLIRPTRRITFTVTKGPFKWSRPSLSFEDEESLAGVKDCNRVFFIRLNVGKFLFQLALYFWRGL